MKCMEVNTEHMFVDIGARRVKSINWFSKDDGISSLSNNTTHSIVKNNKGGGGGVGLKERGVLSY